MKQITLFIAFIAFVTVFAGGSRPAIAQEILLEGPLAGAPAVRKMVQYRKLRVSAGPQFGFTMLNDYMNKFLIGGKLEFNPSDWFGIGAVLYGAVNYPTKLTKYIGDSENIGGGETTPSENNWPSYTGAANFEDQVARLKGMYLFQVSLIPFRGKLSLFEKIFLAIDASIFFGGGIIRVEEREECGSSNNPCGDLSNNDPDQYKPTRVKRTTGAFTTGIAFTAYVNDWFAINLEFRITPFKWNPMGSDEAGLSGGYWVVDADGEWDYQEIYSEDGHHPDGVIDKNDRTWNANMSMGFGFIFYFPFNAKIVN